VPRALLEDPALAALPHRRPWSWPWSGPAPSRWRWRRRGYGDS